MPTSLAAATIVRPLGLGVADGAEDSSGAASALSLLDGDDEGVLPSVAGVT
ncbi:MAG: hypothetical protein AB7I40_16980 [Nocardioides sp.]